MAVIRKSIAGLHRLEHRFDRRAERFDLTGGYGNDICTFISYGIYVRMAVSALRLELPVYGAFDLSFWRPYTILMQTQGYLYTLNAG